jgi:hypothetical protein
MPCIYELLPSYYCAVVGINILKTFIISRIFYLLFPVFEIRWRPALKRQQGQVLFFSGVSDAGYTGACNCHVAVTILCSQFSG